MDDRSDKIVTLARAILEPPAAFGQPRHYSMKTMALVALLSAAAAGTTTATLAAHYRPLNRYEKTEIIALINYAAKTRAMPGAVVEDDFLNQFAIQSLDDLSVADLTPARLFLQKYIR